MLRFVPRLCVTRTSSYFISTIFQSCDLFDLSWARRQTLDFRIIADDPKPGQWAARTNSIPYTKKAVIEQRGRGVRLRSALDEGAERGRPWRSDRCDGSARDSDRVPPP